MENKAEEVTSKLINRMREVLTANKINFTIDSDTKIHFATPADQKRGLEIMNEDFTKMLEERYNS